MKLQLMIDKFAIGLSAMCVIHCLAVPVLLVLLPSTASLGLGNEQFHFWMLAVVLPSSLLALFLGYKKHKLYQLLILGSMGLTLLLSAVLLDENIFGEAGEKILTLLGSLFVIAGYWFNFRLCNIKAGEHCNNE
ncbi:MerC domain-containing protein [Pseudoalteromonas lipolytica]|uniref:MerC domain-containing protein n=1 Tax=Pseudoalteromonas lipolytica TaxID=570156 RepID=A0ABU8T0W0_9GAMM